MADSINVGILEALIKVGYDPKGVATFLDQLTTAKAKQLSAAKETDNLKSSFNRLAASLDPVVARQQKYDQAVRTLDTSLKKGIITQQQYNFTISQAKDKLQDASTWTSRFAGEVGSSLKSSVGSYLAVGAAVTAIVGTVKSVIGQLITANIEAEESQKRVEFAVAKFGDRSGVTAGQIENLAEKYSLLTGVDDEVIADAETLALKYNRISSDILPQLTQLSLDMAESMGGDVSAAMQKAASYTNLPLNALTKLKKEGFAVGDSQAKLVKDLLRTGDVAGAQAEIIKILESQYGGASIAARDTLGGALKALGTSWENLLEKVGEDHLGVLRDGIEKLINLLITVTEWESKFEIGALKSREALDQLDIAVFTLVGRLSNFSSVFNPFAQFFDIGDKANKQVQKSTEDLIAVEGSLLDSFGLLPSVTHSGARGALELTEAEDKLNDKLRQQAEEWQKLLDKARESVISSQDELSNSEALLRARKLSIDAMKLEQAIQNALAKAKQAGKAVTSAQRLEIIRNTIALFQSKNAIDAVGQAEEDLKKSFKDSNDELLRQISILDDLKSIALDLSTLSIDVNINQVSTGGAEATATTKARLDFANEWREAWKSASDKAKEEIQRVMDSLLTVEEKERAIADIRSGLLQENLNQWGSFFGTLGQMFGGLFAKISTSIRNIQQAIEAGNQAGSLLQSHGAGSWAGSLGAIAGEVAIFYEIYKGVSDSIKRDKARTWGDVTSITAVDGQFSSPNFFNQQGQKVSIELRKTLQAVLSALGGVLDDLPQIVIRARRDGKEFSAYVAGVWVGTFKDAQSAMEEGVRYAITHANFEVLSEEMRKALEASISGTFEELEANIKTAQNARRARIGDQGSQYISVSDEWIHEIDAARKLGIGVQDLINKRREELEAIKNSALGIDSSASDSLRSLRSLNLGMIEASDTYSASLQQQIDATLSEIARLENQRRHGNIGNGGDGGDNLEQPGSGSELGDATVSFFKDLRKEADTELDNLHQALNNYLDELGKIPEALSDQEINLGIFNALYKYLEGSGKYAQEAVKYARMKVEIEFAQIKLQLNLLGKWEEFMGMFNDAYAAAQQVAGQAGHKGGGGKGSGGGQKQEARDFLSDRTFNFNLSQMAEYESQIAQINRDYDEQIKKAGKDNQLREQLITLRDQELAQAREDHDKQVEEQSNKIQQEFDSFMGLVTPFDEIRNVAKKLIDELNTSALGDSSKAGKIADVLRRVNEEVIKLSKQKAISLSGELLGDLEAYGIEEGLQFEIRKSMALLEHELKVENYRLEIEKLKAEGRLAPEVIKGFEDAVNAIADFDVTTLFPPPGTPPPGGQQGSGHVDPQSGQWIPYTGDSGDWWNTTGNAIDDVNNSLHEAQDLLDQYTHDGLDPYHQALNDLDKDFAKIFAQFGQGPEIMALYQQALEDINDQFTQDLQGLYDELHYGSQSGVSIDQQLQDALATFNELSAAVTGGDLSQSGEYRDAAQRLLDLLAQTGGTTSAGFGELRDRIQAELAAVLGISTGPGGTGTGYHGLDGPGSGTGVHGLSSTVANANNEIASMLSQSSGISSNILTAINSGSGKEITRLDTMNRKFDDLIAIFSGRRGTGTNINSPWHGLQVG